MVILSDLRRADIVLWSRRPLEAAEMARSKEDEVRRVLRFRISLNRWISCDAREAQESIRCVKARNSLVKSISGMFCRMALRVMFMRPSSEEGFG